MNWINLNVFFIQANACCTCRRFSAIWAVFIIITNIGHAQQRTISGYVRDSTNKEMPSAIVNLINNKEVITRFILTGRNGEFNVTIPANEAALPLWLEVNYVGYKKQRKLITATQSIYNFTLTEDLHILKEVIVKTKPPIELLGDTLRYDVSKFAQNEDRNIGDVLRRMPGIEIADDGTIYHNGKKVSNLYIDGDDLMMGRYGLATKTIRKDMIVSVDVIKNHQPIKVLQNKILSDNTAINLLLKDENNLKLSVNGMLGVGFPKQYDVFVTTILLSKRIKSLNNIGLNNSGINYNNDFRQLGSPGFITDINNKTPPDLALSLATIRPPDLPLANYYLNESEIVNLNNLYKTRKDIQIKMNLQGLNDKSDLNYYNYTKNILKK